MTRKTGSPQNEIGLEVVDSYTTMSKRAADIIVAALKKRPNLVLCASAGGTPTGTYSYLAAEYKAHTRLFSRLTVLQIDEWGGLEPGSPVTCAADLRQKLTNPIHLPSRRYLGFRTNSPDPTGECERVSKWLAANGPIDICILGLGLNGHIAMNEPARELTPNAHIAALTKSSQKHGMLRDLASKPKFGFTLGMRDILCSRQILLLVSGAAKREVLQRLLEPKVSTQFPASFLWLHHNTTLLCDRAAAGKD